MPNKTLAKVYLDPNSPSFKTMDEAADAVSRDFAKQENEQAAVVIKRPDGTYSYSTVAPQNHEDFAISAMLPKGNALAATVHSHPPDGGDISGYFSGPDIDTAKQLNVPSFVRFGIDNSIRKFVPGQTKVGNVPSPGGMTSRVYGAYGDPLSPAPDAASQVPPVSPPAQPAYVQPGLSPSASVASRRDDTVTQY